MSKPKLSKRVTIWDSPNAEHFSKWGNIKYERYCKRLIREAQQVGGDAMHIEIGTGQYEGRICLSR